MDKLSHADERLSTLRQPNCHQRCLERCISVIDIGHDERPVGQRGVRRREWIAGLLGCKQNALIERGNLRGPHNLHGLDVPVLIENDAHRHAPQRFPQLRHRLLQRANDAAREGINLQFCARMINYDLPWVPTRLEQRMGRIHRYGQQRVARIYNLAAIDTREGIVLVKLMDRLEEMRVHLGDGVYDVVSDLVGDAAVARRMAEVVTAAPTDDAQDRAVSALLEGRHH